MGGKYVSYEMLYAMINLRFQKCLKKASKKEENFKLSDFDLVHTVCRKERLTLYNFLKMHLCDFMRVRKTFFESKNIAMTLNEERIK